MQKVRNQDLLEHAQKIYAVQLRGFGRGWV